MRHRLGRRTGRDVQAAALLNASRLPLPRPGRVAALGAALGAALACAGAAAQQAPFSLDDRFGALLERIDELEARLEASERRVEAIAAERDRALERGESVGRANATLEAENATLAGRADELDRENETLDRENEALGRENDRLVGRAEALRAELAAARAGLREPDDAAADDAAATVDGRGAESGPDVDPGSVRDPEPDAALVAEVLCDDALTSEVTGVVARLAVVNPCRAGETLTVRAARATDPLLAQLRARFDADGRAELAFPVLEPGARLRVFGADRADWQDVALSPEADAGENLAVLRWEDALVDLDLVVGPRADGVPGPGRGASGDDASGDGTAGGAPADPGLGSLVLSQDGASAQLPRFEVFVAAPGAPALTLGVEHASRGAVAAPPWCGDADPAGPRLLLVLRRAGALEQVRDALRSVPCGEPVPDALRVRALRNLG